MTWDDLQPIIADIVCNLDHEQERCLSTGTSTDIIRAQMAVGGKRALNDLKRRVKFMQEAEERIRAQELSRKPRRRHAVAEIPTQQHATG